ncbi:MAG: hypothetical protein ACLFVJ_20120 [Persicimonas sp.]
MRHERFDIRTVGRWLALCLAAVVLSACADMGAAGFETPPSGDEAVDEMLLEAQAHLARHDVERAQSTYAGIIAENDQPPGAAHAGKAVCDLLLLPGSSAFSDMIVEHLGATSPVDTGDADQIIYADEGYLYWLARGVPWTDEGDYAGIRSIMSDQLPWEAERLASLGSFFTDLSTPGNDIVDDMLPIATALAQIESQLQLALDDPEFEWIYIPGRTFHYDKLDLILGRSELDLIASTLAMSRGSIYFSAAYEHPWTLDEALGSQPQAGDEPREGWTRVDYAADYFSTHMARELREPAHLREARSAFDEGLEHSAAAIRAGINYDAETTLSWHRAETSYARELIEFIEAVRQSLYGPELLPGSTPETTMDLSRLFSEGRTLDPEIPWLEPVAAEPDAEEAIARWKISDRARQAFFVDGIFEPSFDVDEGGPELDINSERTREFRRSVTGDIEGDVEDAYFTIQ